MITDDNFWVNSAQSNFSVSVVWQNMIIAFLSRTRKVVSNSDIFFFQMAQALFSHLIFIVVVQKRSMPIEFGGHYVTLPLLYLAVCLSSRSLFWPISSAMKTAPRITQSSVQGKEKHMMKCQDMLTTSHVMEEGPRVLWVNIVGPSQKVPKGKLSIG